MDTAHSFTLSSSITLRGSSSRANVFKSRRQCVLRDGCRARVRLKSRDAWTIGELSCRVDLLARSVVDLVMRGHFGKSVSIWMDGWLVVC